MKFQAHRHQWKALTSKARFIGLVSGVQAGKTTCGAVWLAAEIQRLGKHRDYLVVSPTYKVADQSTIVKFKEYFPKNWGKWIERDKIFRLKDGGKIFFRSADKPESIEGITAWAAWIDEAGQIRKLAWETVRARLSRTRGRAILTSTPYAMNWFYSDFYKRWEDGDKTYHIIQFASKDSPYFDISEYQYLEKTMDPRRFRMKYGGQFTKYEGLVYATFDSKKSIIKPHAIPKDARVVMGVDYGVENPTAMLWSYTDKDGNIVIFKEFYKSRKTIKDMAPEFKKHKPKVIYIDPQAKHFRDELTKVYLIPNVMPADNQVDPGISRLQSLFKMGKIKIFSTCTNLIDEIESYRYKEDRDGDLVDKVVKKYDHACDALRYLVHSQAARPVLKVSNPIMSWWADEEEEQNESEWAYG